MNFTPTKVHEGFCETIYEDSLGHLTFGIGHLIKPSDPEYGKPCGTNVSSVGPFKSNPQRILSAFDADMAGVEADVYKLYPDFDCQPDFVQTVVGDMMFNMGYAGLSEFGNMKQCILDKDYDCAANEIRYTKSGSGVLSDYCKQTRRRCDRLESMMRSQSADHGYAEADINKYLCTCS